MKRGVLLTLATGLLGLASLLTPSMPGQTPAQLDEQQLKTLGLPTDTPALLTYFRQRSLKDGDRKVLEELVAKLGSETYSDRARATRELLLRGPLALPFLRAALKDQPLEVVRRAEACIRKIESSMGNEASAVAARVLAARGAPGAAEVLLNYLPYAADPWLQEEILTSIGRLTVKEGRIDELLTRTLKDPLPARRAAAAYILARRGGTGPRTALRPLLEDGDALVRQRVAEGLIGTQAARMLKEAAAADDGVLRAQKVEPTEAGALDFLRKRTLNETDQRRLAQLVRNLGDPSYVVRVTAARRLVSEGTPALAFLKPAASDPDYELRRRAQACIEQIRQGPGPALPTAAVHLLARASAPKNAAVVVRTLLGYVPFADDDSVEDEVLTALNVLSVRSSQLDPALAQAAADPLPARRGAAAYVLGHVGTRENLPALHRLLDDPAPQVRLRAAQGLLAAREKAAVPKLIALLNDLPANSLWRVEELLHRLAGDAAPPESLAVNTGAARQKAMQAWQKWWQSAEAKTDLGRLGEVGSYLGLVTVCEYDSPFGQPGGRVWEASRESKPRWSVTGVLGAMDAHTLPNGRVLIAENSANRVTERDLRGNVKWEHRVPGNPITCQRLPNGNTFIAMYNMVLEVTPDHKEVYRHAPGPQFYIFGAHKARNGHIVAITAQGMVIEMEAKTGKQVRTLNLGANGNWCGIEMLPNGNYLVATLNNSQIRELTPGDGKTIWQATYNGAFRATRLPNGNTLVASMTTRKVAELDRAGAVRWERSCSGRPWNVHYR